MYCICIVLCQLSNCMVWHSDRGTNKTAFFHICSECCYHGAPQLEEQLLKLKMPEKTKSLFLGRCPHGDLADQAELSAELAKSAQPK